MRIYKYVLMHTGMNEVEMPVGANILSVGLDPADMVCIWAIVNPELESKTRKFYVAGTGWDLRDAVDVTNLDMLTCLGTVRQTPYMWHIFEVI